MANQTHLIYPDGIRQAVEANTERLEGYSLTAIIQGGLDVEAYLYLFKRSHPDGNEFAASDMIAIDSRGMISDMSV